MLPGDIPTGGDEKGFILDAHGEELLEASQQEYLCDTTRPNTADSC